MTRPEITPDLLREFLRYDPETGKLYFRPRDRKWFDSDARCAWWHQRFAGKEALKSPKGEGENSYREGAIWGQRLRAHRAIWAMTNDEWPDEIDHINGVRSDNRLCNLRNVTGAENHRNLARSVRNRSGQVGVCREGRTGKWLAYICVDGSQRILGSFNNKHEAGAVRRAAEVKYDYHPNHGREQQR